MFVSALVVGLGVAFTLPLEYIRVCPLAPAGERRRRIENGVVRPPVGR